MKRRFTLSVAALLIAGLSGFLLGVRHQLLPELALPELAPQGLVSSVRAQSQLERPVRGRECTAALLQGAYSFSAEGFITAVPPGFPYSPGPYATVGLVNFDGAGNFSLSNTQSYNGVVVPPGGIAGAYVIGNDCSGRMTLATGAVFNFVAADLGKEIHFMQVNNGTVIRGVAKKI